MRTSKSLAVAGSALALAAAAAIPATAGTAHHPAAAHHPATGKHGTFKGKISPKKGIKNGTKVKLTVKKGAEKHTDYLCLFAIVKGTANGPNTLNNKSVTSNGKGAFKCTLKFKSFSEQVGTKNVKCPPTKKETKQGYICGFAAANPANPTGSNTFQYLNFKK